MLKQIMIPMAAFAVTVTGVSAFNSDLLDKINVDLTDNQVEVLEEVHELRQSGEVDREEVRDMLDEAGLDQEKMKEIHEATREVKNEMREAIDSAIEGNNYDEFLEAIVGTPLEDVINSESDFESFAKAHSLKESGDHEGAAEIMSELGIEKPEGHGQGHGPRGEEGVDGERPEGGDGEHPEQGEGKGFGGPGSRGNR